MALDPRKRFPHPHLSHERHRQITRRSPEATRSPGGTKVTPTWPLVIMGQLLQYQHVSASLFNRTATMNESPGLPSDFNGEVRLFPLPELVLFPGNVLPLHIFEARYREMTREALEEDQLITMATLLGPEEEGSKPPEVATEVCIGRIVAHEKLVNGRYHLALAGLQRALISREIETPAPFRRAIVHVLAEDDDRPEESRALVDAMARQIVPALPAARPARRKAGNG